MSGRIYDPGMRTYPPRVWQNLNVTPANQRPANGVGCSALCGTVRIGGFQISA